MVKRRESMAERRNIGGKNEILVVQGRDSGGKKMEVGGNVI